MYQCLIILLVVINFTFEQEIDFCSKEYNCFSNTGLKVNSICELNHNCGVGPNCIKYESYFLTETDKKSLLDKSNELRNKHALGKDLTSRNNRFYPFAANMRELVWDEDLEFQAQCWANQCPTTEASCVTKSDTRLAQQNIEWSLEDNILDSMQSFYNEGMNANVSVVDNYVTLVKGPKINHFAQLISANTTNMGCGRSKYYYEKTNQVIYCLVCNYAIQWNMEGSEIYIKGPPCSKCTEGSQCHSKYTGLCTTKKWTEKAPDYCKSSSDPKNCKSPFVPEKVRSVRMKQLQEMKNTTTKQPKVFYTKKIIHLKKKMMRFNSNIYFYGDLPDNIIERRNCIVRKQIIIINGSAEYARKLSYNLMIMLYLLYYSTKYLNIEI